MNSRNSMKFVDVDITDAKELNLVVKDGGNGSYHATWDDTKIHYISSEIFDKTQKIDN